MNSFGQLGASNTVALSTLSNTTGREFDQETGSALLQGRATNDQNIGRFIQRGSHSVSKVWDHFYSYVKNRPV